MKTDQIRFLIREIVAQTMSQIREANHHDVARLRHEMVRKAQEVYDAWDQSDEHGDPELGFGGICQDIAEAISDVLNENGVEAMTVDNQGVGEQHVWCVAKLADGIYEVDIPYSIYERGGGYNWQKIDGVEFRPENIYIGKVGSFEDFPDLFSETGRMVDPLSPMG